MLGFEGVGLEPWICGVMLGCSACVKTYFMGEFTHSVVGINIS